MQFYRIFKLSLPQFATLKDERIKGMEALLKDNPRLKGQIKRLRKAPFTTNLVVKKETFDQLLEQMDEIVTARLDVGTYVADNPLFRPIQDAKKKTLAVTFDRDRTTVGRYATQFVPSENSMGLVQRKWRNVGW